MLTKWNIFSTLQLRSNWKESALRIQKKSYSNWNLPYNCYCMDFIFDLPFTGNSTWSNCVESWFLEPPDTLNQKPFSPSVKQCNISEFNWKHGQIQLLCYLWAVMFMEADRFAYKSIRIHRGRFAGTTLVDSPTLKKNVLINTLTG